MTERSVPPSTALFVAPGTKRRSPAKILGVLLFGFLLLALATELSLRYVLGLGNALLAEQDAAAGYVYKPDQHVKRFFCNTDINHYSMRSPPFALVKPQGTYRVMLVGDSMTYGSTQVDQGALFASLLRLELPARLHMPVEVLNGSAGAWAIGNEFGYLKSRGTFDSDLVVLVLNSGDLAQSPSSLGDIGGDAATVKPPCALCELWTRYLKAKLFHVRAKVDAGTTLSSNDPANVRPNLVWLDQFQQTVQAHHARMGLVFLAMRQYVPDHAAQSAPAIMVSWAAQHHVPFVDVTPAETGYTPKQITRDGIHFNKLGHRVTATYLEQHWGDLDPSHQ